MNKDTLGNILKKLRKEKGMTQQELAEKISKQFHLSVKQDDISRYENDKQEINLDVLKAFRSYFNVSADYLLGLTETKSIKADIRMISDYTGLNDNTIEELHRLPEYISSYINFYLCGQNGYFTAAFLGGLDVFKENVEAYQKDLKEVLCEAEQIANNKESATRDKIAAFINRITESENKEKEKDYSEFCLQKSMTKLYEIYGYRVYSREEEAEIRKRLYSLLYQILPDTDLEGDQNGDDQETE